MYFHLISSYTRVRVKKPLKSPVSVGLVQQYIVLNPTETGGGQSDPRVHKFACYGRKTKKNPNLGHGNDLSIRLSERYLVSE